MLKKLLAVLGLSMASAMVPHAVQADEPVVRVSVKDAYVHGLMVGSSDVFSQDVVVANFPSHRVAMDASFDSTDHFYAALATALAARNAKVDGVQVLKPTCVADAPPIGERLPLRDTPVSVGFNRIPVSTLLGLVAEQNGLAVQGTPPAPEQVVGVRMKKRTWHDILRATAAATGAAVSLDEATGRATAKVTGAAHPACLEPPPPEQPAAPTPRHCPMKDHPLTKRSGKVPVCEPLEAYRLDDLVVRGFIDFRSDRSVLLEGPDRLTFFVKVGDYLGHHMGKITRMDDAGFVVREVRQDAAGMYFHADTRIGYDSQRTAMERPER